LNVTTDLSYFSHILPCGIPDKGITSMAVELGDHVPAMVDVEDAFLTEFQTRIEAMGPVTARVA
jgi:lipoyl(octanoyl) transferase